MFQKNTDQFGSTMPYTMYKKVATSSVIRRYRMSLNAADAVYTAYAALSKKNPADTAGQNTGLPLDLAYVGPITV